MVNLRYLLLYRNQWHESYVRKWSGREDLNPLGQDTTSLLKSYKKYRNVKTQKSWEMIESILERETKTLIWFCWLMEWRF